MHLIFTFIFGLFNNWEIITIFSFMMEIYNGVTLSSQVKINENIHSININRIVWNKESDKFYVI